MGLWSAHTSAGGRQRTDCTDNCDKSAKTRTGIVRLHASSITVVSRWNASVARAPFPDEHFFLFLLAKTLFDYYIIQQAIIVLQKLFRHGVNSSNRK